MKVTFENGLKPFATMKVKREQKARAKQRQATLASMGFDKHGLPVPGRTQPAIPAKPAKKLAAGRAARIAGLREKYLSRRAYRAF